MPQRLLALIILVTALVVAPFAQADAPPSTIDYIDSLQAPPLMDGIGNSHIEITTDVEAAQLYFDQGVSLLHDFWWFEAYRSFRHAAQLDPDAPMPYWGVYLAASQMANLSGDERDVQQALAIEKIAELRDNASDRERYYLDAVTYLDEGDGDEASHAYRRELEALLSEYPDEIEGRLFLWLELKGGFDARGRPYDDQVYGQLLLESELEKHADHQGLLHYWIHNQEPGKHPETALDAAKHLASLAPNAGHIVHMPGHIHFLMGNHDAAHQQFQLAEQADSRYMETFGIEPIFTWNYLHNISFLIANLAEAGRYEEARDYAGKFAAMTAKSKFKDYSGYSMLSGRVVLEPMRLAIRSGDFVAAAQALRNAPEFQGEDPEGFAARKAAYVAYTEGMASAQAGDSGAASAAAHNLDSVLWRAGRNETNIRGQSVLKIASLELEGMVEYSDGNIEASIALLERAIALEAELRYREPPPYVRPVVESLAQVYLATEQWDKAREAYQDLLEKRRGSGYGLFGIARSYELEGKMTEAAAAYRRFLEAWASADAELPEKHHAATWLAANSGGGSGS